MCQLPRRYGVRRACGKTEIQDFAIKLIESSTNDPSVGNLIGA